VRNMKNEKEPSTRREGGGGTSSGRGCAEVSAGPAAKRSESNHSPTFFSSAPTSLPFERRSRHCQP
jgi:hypothetical protein